MDLKGKMWAITLLKYAEEETVEILCVDCVQDEGTSPALIQGGSILQCTILLQLDPHHDICT